ncbi:beta-ketoacyl synthase N-terminal-like domain-containing protein [Streptomyces sp. NPDC047525]|uniref:beta-ketoacyl synthase N-terminal-like domain-containing protein n=1 Tax=Streptomyces sp. NPDC047525 TaxID=3155264 RepID=UPI0033FE95FF
MADEEKLQKYLRKATAELRQARGRLAVEEAKTREPVAIIGIGCRFPGNVRSPEDLWRLVDGGEDVITGLPEDRGWNLAGAMPELRGGFLDGADEFDAEFFGMDPAEARATDPQQRLLLETSWEAFERAGIDPLSAKETRTAVYAGLQFGGYPLLLREPPGPDVQGYLGFGNSVGAGSGRVAYLMGLLGAAVTVDTQCTSSLVAVHLAAKALRNGECTLALAGGAAVMSLPTTLMEFRRTGKLSSDGRSRSFAASADGVSLSEGAGMLLLERLSDARRNGHPVLAVIRGSAINQDGATNGMSAPRGQAQERVIRQALADARLSAESVDVVEGHGVGAALGDGVEASSVITVYGSEHSPEHPVLLGSVKSNIGHTQTVGAIAGITKLVMALLHERVPATLHMDAPTTHANWSAGTVEVAAEARPWRAGERVRRAAVSCLTLSGTNAHLILEEPPAEEPAEHSPAAVPAPATAPVAWPLSARTPGALRELAARLREAVADTDPRDTAAALVRGRSSFRHRAVVVGDDRDELLTRLDALAAGHVADGVAQGGADPRGHTALLFTGDAPARPGTARELYEAFPLFARALDEVCGQLDASVRAGLLDAGRPYESPVSARLAGFALQVALHRLVTGFGVAPRRLAGHGLGEVAAAHAAGALSLADSCALATALAQADGDDATADLASVWIRAGEEELRHEPELAEHAVLVAAVDEPGATLLTGRPDAVTGLAERWRSRGRDVRVLQAALAVRPAGTESPVNALLARTVAGLSPSEPQVPLVSTGDGQTITPERLRDAAFWAERLRLPSHFLNTVRQLLAQGVTRFVDLDPEAALAPLVARAAAGHGDPGRTLLPVSLLAGSQGPGGEARALLSALASLYADGVGVDWEPALEGHIARRADLPTYPFQRRRHWLVPPDGAAPQPQPSAFAHPLLGVPIELATGGDRWFGTRITDGTPPSAALPRVHGTALLSPAALVDWALATARHGHAPQDMDTPRTLREVRLHDVPELPGDSRALTLQAVREQRADGERVRGFVSAGDAWQPSFTALVSGPDARPSGTRAKAEEYDAEQWRQRLWRLGVADDPEAGRVTGLHTGPGHAEAVVEREGTAAAGPWQLSPLLLETVFRIAALAADDDAAVRLRTVGSIDRFTVHGPLPGTVRVAANRCDDGSVTLEVTSEQGEPLLVAEGLRLRPAARDEPPTAAVELRAHELVWQPVPGPLRTALPGAREGSWLIHSGDAELAGRWREQLALAGVSAFSLMSAGEPTGDEDGVLPLDMGVEEPFEQIRKELAGRGTTIAGLLLHDDGTAGREFRLLRGFLRSCAAEEPAVVVCSTAASAPAEPGAGLGSALARTTAWEHPELNCVSVELDVTDALPDAAELLGRAAQLGGSGRLSSRGGRWYEARLRERALKGGAAGRTARQDTGPMVRAGAAYLVVGDGPEAGAVADWLVAHGAAEVERTGDDPAEVAAALKRDAPTVRGVVHLAAAAPELALADWDPAGFERALEQAVAVPRLLHEQAGELDFLVLCSPFATLPGKAGTAVATAAAEYADGLARHRRAAGSTTVSLACGPWREADGDTVAELAAWGLHPAPVGAVFDAVSEVLTGSGAYAALARADWNRYRTAAGRTTRYVPLEETATDTGQQTVGFGQGNMNSD